MSARALLPLLLLAACGGGKTEDTCGRLANAIAACGVAHGVPASVYAADACADWDEEMDRVLGPSYTCRAEVWENADCSSDAGWAAALQADACCAPPGSTTQPGAACEGLAGRRGRPATSPPAPTPSPGPR